MPQGELARSETLQLCQESLQGSGPLQGGSCWEACAEVGWGGGLWGAGAGEKPCCRLPEGRFLGSKAKCHQRHRWP